MHRGRLAAFLVVLCFAGIPAAQTPEDLMRRGNAAYEQGLYEEAAEHFRGILRYSVSDPTVEYNLGNAEFRLGNLGRSILHYERARRLDPLDEDIRGNLEFARSLCFDRVEAQPQAAAIRWLRAVQNRLGPDRQAWAGLILAWFAAGLIAWGFARPGRWSAAHGWTLAALFLAMVVTAPSWYVTLERLEGGRAAVVLEEVVEVLAGPSYNNPALFTVHEGLKLEIRSERDEWYQVSLPNGLNGWIAKEAVGVV
jgi:tetratricopeptide (TPR) repeat protein